MRAEPRPRATRTAPGETSHVPNANLETNSDDVGEQGGSVAQQPTLGQLEEAYPDPSFRRNLFDLLSVSNLLADSIIGKDYVVPPALHNHIGLTDYGNKVYDQLRRRSVPFHEARLLCFLEMYYTDLLIDVDTTDRQAIVEILSKQVANRNLAFPFIFGRILYDKYFEKHEDGAGGYLTPDETQRLLQGTPQGVAQYSELVTGPYGILKSRSSRNIRINRDVSLRHCSDRSCAVIHKVFLSTNYDAPINKHRETLGKILEKEDGRSSSWSQFVQSIAAKHISVYQDWASEPIAILIGDALADSELIKLLNFLLDGGDGYLQNLFRNLGLNSEKSAIAGMSRAELLQLILAEESDQIVSAIDILVRDEDILVPYGEIRKPVLNADIQYGMYGLRAELGRYGVRLRSSGPSLAPLRARRLVEQMYRLDQEADREELDWQMRDEPNDSLEAKLEHYLQTKPPERAIGSLVLARRSNVVVATTSLRLANITFRKDQDLVNAILWKLGFAIDDLGEDNTAFWESLESVLQRARRGIVTSQTADREHIRGAASTYFTALERLLDDSLAYTVWALTNDHYSSPKPFVYRPHLDRAPAFKRLNDFGSDSREKLGNRNTLYPLTRAWAKLAAYLQDLEDNASDYERAGDDVPEWTSVQTLEKFPFQHTIPYLDLLPGSRSAIIKTLEEITNQFVSGQVSEARNDWMHGQRTTPVESLDRLREGIDDVREAVRHIEESGMSRQGYTAVSDTTDGDHRRTVVLAGPDGRNISLFGPSPFSWLRLPRLTAMQYVMNSARFAEPIECLRFTLEVESPYSQMWENYPRRPRMQRGKVAAGQAPLTAQVLHA